MRAKWHLLVSLAVAMVSLLFSQNTPFLGIELFGYRVTVFVLCIVIGVFVDVDHIIDYHINRWRISQSLESRFMEGRMFVVFHGIENAVVLAGLSIVFPFLIFPTASYICHLIMDIYGNGVSFQAYFYIVRFGRKLINA